MKLGIGLQRNQIKNSHTLFSRMDLVAMTSVEVLNTTAKGQSQGKLHYKKKYKDELSLLVRWAK